MFILYYIPTVESRRWNKDVYKRQSVVFVNIIYTLTISFGDVGKALAVVLLVIQVAGAGGTFPIEVTPHFFRMVNPMLPFTHAINAMRECVGGIYGNAYFEDMGKILRCV